MCPFHIQEVSVFLFFWESKRSVSVISATIQSFLMSLRHFRIQVEVAVTSCCNWRHCKTISAGKYHRLSISHEEEAQTNGHQAVFCFFHRWFKTQNHTHFRPFICSPLHSGSWIWIFQHSLYRDYWENFSCVRSTAEIWKKCMYFWRRKLLSVWTYLENSLTETLKRINNIFSESAGHEAMFLTWFTDSKCNSPFWYYNWKWFCSSSMVVHPQQAIATRGLCYSKELGMQYPMICPAKDIHLQNDSGVMSLPEMLLQADLYDVHFLLI